MVSTLTILLVSGLSLFLVWNILRPGLPQIKSLEDWEAKKHEADAEVFRILVDPMEEKYLQRSLPPREFRVFQRRRIVLALRWLDLVGENAGMLMKLGQLARTSTNPTLAKEAEDLIYARAPPSCKLVGGSAWLVAQMGFSGVGAVTPGDRNTV